MWKKDDGENIVVVQRDDAILQCNECREEDKCVKWIMLACDDLTPSYGSDEDDYEDESIESIMAKAKAFQEEEEEETQ